MSKHADAVLALADAVLLDDSPQGQALGDAVADHLSNRERPPRAEPDPAVLEALRAGRMP